MDNRLATANGTRAPKPVTKSGRPKRVYKCRDCQKVFKRSEHCARHERVHTQEKPFPCRYCDRRYARKDLVKRHERTLHAEVYTPAIGSRSRRSSDSGNTVALEIVQGPFDSTAQRNNRAPEDIQSDISGSIDADASLERLAALRRTSVNHQSPGNSQIVMPSSVMSPSIFSDNRNVGDYGMEMQTSPSNMLDHRSPAGGADQNAQLSTAFPNRSGVNRTRQTSTDLPLSLEEVLGLRPTLLQNGRVSPEARSHVGIDASQIDPNLESPTKRRRLNSDAEQSASDIKGPDTVANSVPELDASAFDIFQDFSFMSEAPFGLPENALINQYIPPDSTPYMPHGDAMNFGQWSRMGFDSQSAESITGLMFEGSTPTFEHGQSRRLFEQLPQVLKEKSANPPKFTFDDSVHQNICSDAQSRIKPEEWNENIVPSVKELQRFFSSYLDCFHRHLPIIHLPSLHLEDIPSPLMFAICTIGAIYRLDRKRALALYGWADRMLHDVIAASRSGSAVHPSPLWAVQGRLLLFIYAVFSGKPSVVSTALDHIGLFTIEYRLRRAALMSNPKPPAELSWDEWVRRESGKRLLCAMFIISNLISVTYNLTPGFSITLDLMIEMPDEERLWDARSAEQWQELRESRSTIPRKTIREVMVNMIFGNQPNETGPANYQVSGFTTLVIMHAVNVHMWNLLQFTQSFSCSFDMLADGSIQTMLLAAASSALSRCHHALTHGQTEDHESTWNNADGPLMFNSQALLRIAYVRLFTSTSTFNRLVLLTDNKEEIAAAVSAYANAPQQRNNILTKAVARAYEGFLTPVKIGHLLVRKTAAFSWSVEHAIAGWDCALFFTKWVSTVEIQASALPPDEEESQILEQLKELMVEVESDYDGSGSLAAAVAKAWASFLDDVWVWGITPRMGAILYQLSLAYEKCYQNERVATKP